MLSQMSKESGLCWGNSGFHLAVCRFNFSREPESEEGSQWVRLNMKWIKLLKRQLVSEHLCHRDGFSSAVVVVWQLRQRLPWSHTTIRNVHATSGIPGWQWVHAYSQCYYPYNLIKRLVYIGLGYHVLCFNRKHDTNISILGPTLIPTMFSCVCDAATSSD